MSRNLERERARNAARMVARKAWEQFVWERTHNAAGSGSARNRDGGGKKAWGVNAVIIRPDKQKKKQLGGEPYGRGNGISTQRRLPNRRWRPAVGGVQDLRTVRRNGRS